MESILWTCSSARASAYALGLVELNQRLLRRSELERVTIVDGDTIEVVLPAFGG